MFIKCAVFDLYQWHFILHILRTENMQEFACCYLFRFTRTMQKAQADIKIYSSLEEYRQTFTGVDMDVFPINSGEVVTIHRMQQLDRVILGRHSINNSLVHHAYTEEDQFYIIIPVDKTTYIVDGKLVPEHGLFIVSPGEETFSWHPNTADSITISFKREALRKCFGEHEIHALESTTKLIREGKAELTNLNEFKHEIMTLYQAACIANNQGDASLLRALEEQLLAGLHQLFAPLIAERKKTTTNTRKRIVQRAIENVKAPFSNELTIPELAKKTFCSVRTLEYSFNAVLAMSPSLYMKKQKLNRVREVLLTDKSSSIKEIFNAMKIKNHGRFSSDYKNMFGELPSYTKKQSRMASSHRLTKRDEKELPHLT